MLVRRTTSRSRHQAKDPLATASGNGYRGNCGGSVVEVVGVSR